MVMNRESIANRIQAMPSDLVKTAVLRWLLTPGSLDDLEQTLKEETTLEEESDWEWGEVSASLQFMPLSEQEMVHHSLQALEEYQRTGQGIDHEQMKAWAANLGTDRELPCP
ncbi:hypothetical protein [Scytonema sp. NUACC26]|uniref:hypothetical protein n=1 Tax=Scytonema sp. NUACC26 TaxID=3140176 RepID=UPI0034DBC3BD